VQQPLSFEQQALPLAQQPFFTVASQQALSLPQHAIFWVQQSGFRSDDLSARKIVPTERRETSISWYMETSHMGRRKSYEDAITAAGKNRLENRTEDIARINKSRCKRRRVAAVNARGPDSLN
jgi:hypothetical protein